MILQPCNVELTKVHYYDKAKHNLSVSTISREVSQNDFNRNVIIKRNVFGYRWVLRLNDAQTKEKTKLRVVVYALVFCSIVVAVSFGIFFSIYKNRYKTADSQIIQSKPIINVTDFTDTFINKTHEDQVNLETSEISTTVKNDPKTGTADLNETSTSSRTSMCGDCDMQREVCLKMQETDAPKCVKISDRNDPTGCGGLCPINTHFCQILDSKGKVYQCSPVKKALVCPNNTFNCGNMCISLEKHCDGLVDCSNYSDEKNCICDLETHFHCGNSTSCLDKKKKCDQKVDCWDKSDEMGCSIDISCATEEIPCGNGQCVANDNFCDGKFDCLDRTDEPEGCVV